MKKESFLHIPKHHIDTAVQRPSLLYTSSVSSSILNSDFSQHDDNLQENEDDDGTEFKNLRNFHFNSTSSYSSIYSTKRKMKKSDRNRRRTICSTTASYDSNDKLSTIDETDSNTSISSSNKTLKNSLKSISPSPPRSSVSFHRRFASLPENISLFTYIHGKKNNNNNNNNKNINHDEFNEIMDTTTDNLESDTSFDNDTIIIHKLNNNMLNDILNNDMNNTSNLDKTLIKEGSTDTSCIKFRSPFMTDEKFEKRNKFGNSNTLDNSNIANLRHFASHDTGLNKRSNWNIIFNNNITNDSNNKNNVDIQKPILSMDQAHATLITSSPTTQKIKNTDYIIHNKKSFPDISPSITNVTTSIKPAKSNINNKFQSLLPTIEDTSFNDLDLDSDSDSDSDSGDDDGNCATSVRSLETFGNEDAQPFFTDGDLMEHKSDDFQQFSSVVNENDHSNITQDKPIDCLEGFDVNNEYIPKQRLLRSKSHESIFSTLKDKKVKAKTNNEKLELQTFKWLPKPKTIVTTSLSLLNQSSNLGMPSKLSPTDSNSYTTRNQNTKADQHMNTPSSVYLSSQHHQSSSASLSFY
ncbi:unnamed protein product [[Candida] boidinii]|nr:unnamed protein product [[Candida] boidinii]